MRSDSVFPVVQERRAQVMLNAREDVTCRDNAFPVEQDLRAQRMQTAEMDAMPTISVFPEGPASHVRTMPVARLGAIPLINAPREGQVSPALRTLIVAEDAILNTSAFPDFPVQYAQPMRIVSHRSRAHSRLSRTRSSRAVSSLSSGMLPAMESSEERSLPFRR